VGVNNYQGFTPGKTEVLKKGAKPYNARPLESDIRIDHDVEIVVRDGCRLYADIYRPADIPEDEKLPAVISWGRAMARSTQLFTCCLFALGIAVCQTRHLVDWRSSKVLTQLCGVRVDMLLSQWTPEERAAAMDLFR
jgi:hypothetical protein